MIIHAKAASAGSNLRRAGAARLALLCLLALLLALFAAPAQAAPVTIAEFGENAGQVSGPYGVAVHRVSGNFYVADRNNFRIDKFDPEGNFLMAWGFGVADGTTAAPQTCGPEATPPTSRCFQGLFATGAGSVAPLGVAVDQSSGAVYVSEGLSRWRVSKFTPSGLFVFMVGRNVNKTKLADGGATQAEKNICTAASGDTCGAGEAGSGPNEFSAVVGESQFQLTSMAVDSAGVVWVGSVDRLSSFDSSGAPGAEIAMPGAGLTQSLALDSADNFYVISESLPGVRKLEAGTGALLETIDEGGSPRTVTLDEDDNLYVGHCVTADQPCTNPYRFDIYNPAGEQTAQFGAGEVIGTPGGSTTEGGGNALAVDKDTGKLYSASSVGGADSVVQAFPLPEPGPLVVSQGVENLEPTTVTLTANLNPEGNETTYHFEYGTTDSYGQSTPTQTLPGTGFDAETAQADLEGLIPDTTYHFRLVATNHCNPAEPAEECTVEGPDTTFTTLPAVDIKAQWATDITATSAVLHAEMDPLGVEAEAWLEYGTSDGYGQVVPLANLGDGFGAVARQALLTGLQPGTVYHYRFVARDVRDGNTYTVHGADRTFTTQVSALGFQLADNRSWEMVSPPNKFGGLIDTHPDGEGLIQAAGDGSALTYLSLGSIEPVPEGNRAIEYSSVLARRDGAGSWNSKDITPPHTTVTPIALGNGFEYKLFSSNLEQSLLQPRDTTLLSPQASERTPYLRQNTEPATYTPLVTGKEGFANVPPGTVFGGDPNGFNGAVSIAGASPDLRHVVLGSQVPLAAGAAVASLYAWEAGQLHPVSILPAGEGGATVGAQLGSGDASVRKAISDHGSRVFWSTPANDLKALYVRDMDREETVRLDVVQPGALGKGAANPVFQGANAEGTVAIFTDSHQLTEDANEKGRDLYRCEVAVEADELVCNLTNLTAATVGAKEDAEVQGLASGMSDDGTRIYFVARGVLDSGPNGMGDSAVPGQPNLYLWQEGTGARFIATLSNADENDWAPLSRAHWVTAAASPSGRYLAFMSQRSLTGYDNRDAKTDELTQEVFRYDAAADELICASCNPSGASPAGLKGLLAPQVDPQNRWQGRALAAVLPEATKAGLSGPSLYRPRAVHDNGRLFFNAADSLVPADSNGTWDVYQYEPSGTGDCSSSSGGAAISRSAGGCVSLISSGTANEESAFLDASVGGDDVFFLTPARLSVTDEDQEVDVYDARVNGIPATLTPNAECLGEACQPAARVPNDPTPASAAFRGQGNVNPPARKRCAKGKRVVRRNGRTRCVARKRKKGKAARSKRAARHHRRASR